jgi:UDP-glucose:(heptosyl)LPS alpha-1,3-glucosyltransferase
MLGQQKFDTVFSLERTLRQDIYRAGDGCHRQWLQQKNLGKGLLSRIATYLNPIQLAYIWLEKRLFTDPDLKAIIANSSRGKDEIVNLYGVAPDRIQVVHNGVDLPEVSVQERDASRSELSETYGIGNALRILYVGSGFKRKGVPVLLQAAAQLEIPFHLFIVGKEKLGSYRRLAQRLGIGRQVTFTGPRKDVETFYKGCDIFVFPTLYDPFSNATLEAMAYGLPTVTTLFNGVSELIESGQNGYLLTDPLDAAQLAEIMTGLQHAELRCPMGRSAEATARQFTMARNVQATLEIIETVAASSSRPE